MWPEEMAIAFKSPGADSWAKTLKGDETKIKKSTVVTKRSNILMTNLHLCS
jgi:hypothetical protein